MPTKTISKGTRVKLGDGREGTIIRKEERAGFQGYIVKITKSQDKSQIGQTVGATVPGMKVISQIAPKPIQPTVPAVQNIQPQTFKEQQKKIVDEQIKTIETDKQQKDKEMQALNQLKQTLAHIQNRIYQLSEVVVNDPKEAQIMPQKVPTGSDPMGNLEDLEEKNDQELEQQENLEQQQEISQQQNQQMQQMLTQQQGLQQKFSGRNWVKAERANVRIAFNDRFVYCDVAATPKQQASGLQAYDVLPNDRGLWFPQNCRRVATFHMGDVGFPIDIVFIDSDTVKKVVANVRPRSMGSWSCECTDVVEVNGGWCDNYGVTVGSIVETPLTSKKRARSEIERVINTSWSGPQKARITSDKDGGLSYDPLRTITEADNQNDDLIEEVEELFPELKQADNKTIYTGPMTGDPYPGEVDKRNPLHRFRDRDLPPVSSPQGEDNPDTVVDPYDREHWEMQIGYDPDTFREEDHPHAIRPSAQKVEVQSPEPLTELSGVDTNRLMQGSIQLYTKHAPKWKEGIDSRKYKRVAVIDDNTISTWIDALGFDEANESSLRKAMFTNSYKRLLGDALISAGEISDYELLDSDLLLYQQ